MAASAAWAGTGNGSGYMVLQDGSCTLSNAGDICDVTFTLPAQARVGDVSILSYVETCTDLGSGINFDVEILVNVTHSVRSYGFGTGTQRGLWEDIGSNIFQAGENNIQFVATGDDIGECRFEDINLQYRLTSVP
jgi:hypothetical protein